MEKLVSSWYNNVQPLPETYIFPPNARPGKLSTLPSSDNIPVINLGGGGAEGHDRTRIVEQILEASQEFGFFQVINHGISENLLHDTMDVFREFFALPPEDKASFFSEDPNKLCRLITSTGNYDRENVHLWRDALRHPCHPLEKFIPLWPQQPLKYREHVGKCSTQVRKVALNILDLISEGLGIGYGHFSDELSQETLLSVNYYPPCPDPSLTLGITKHCDPNLITILLQGDVHGLQVFKDGEWIGVEPLPQGLVVNIGYQLQIISNGKLKCAEHRAVTNSSNARTSAAFFIAPSQDCHIQPAAALINASNPQIYKGFQYKEFLSNYLMKQGNTEVVLEPFKLQI
ncbi:flavanone 3-dioxygenase 2-like [Rosa rugosa]|uniref:flavanone 3-dioxygenase 2-like n=1 Tax=Rosa rugosa TaxID=74645 RepID=UPI002B412640|nr:flavanone 3-dioxygenase 2-like [Rosa rugosa]